MKRVVNVKVLHGEPLDGSGKVCIHLLVPDNNGPFVCNDMLYMTEEENEDGKKIKKLVSKPTQCRLACSPNKTVKPTIKNGVTSVTMRTDDPRSTTCVKCKRTDAYKLMIERLRTL